MLLAAMADPVVLAGMFKTLGWTLVILVGLVALGALLVVLGLGKVLTAPLKIFSRKGKAKDE